MRIEPLGDSAYIVRDLGDVPSYTLARSLEQLSLPGVVEIVPAYETLGVYVEAESFDQSRFLEAIREVKPEKGSTGKHHAVPVCYELGEDRSEERRVGKECRL